MAHPASDAPALLTVEETAGLLRISPSTLYRLVAMGGSPVEPRRIGSLIRFSAREVDEYVGAAEERSERRPTRRARREHRSSHRYDGGGGSDSFANYVADIEGERGGGSRSAAS